MDGMAERADLGTALTNWQLADTPVCAVRLTAIHGLGVTEPAQLLLTDGVTAYGGLLGGAADPTARQLAQQVLDGGAPLRTEIHVDASEATDAGLACAGSVTVFAHLLPAAQAELLAEGLRTGTPVAMLACSGGVLVVSGHDGEWVASELAAEPTSQAVEQIQQLLRRGVSCTSSVDLEAENAPVDVWVHRAGLLLIGSGALRDALATQAELLGWSVRTSTGVAQTEQAVASLTAADAVVLLDHDPAFDGALLRCARGLSFAGALGSRQTQADRRERLLVAGATEDELDRVHGPVGLDLGARTPSGDSSVGGGGDHRVARRASAQGTRVRAWQDRGVSRGRRQRCTAGVWTVRLVLGAVVIAVVVIGGTAFRVWQVARDDSRAPADAMLVLGAAQYDGTPSSVFAARLEHARTLYALGVAPRVITVGGKQPGDEFTEAAAGRNYLIKEGVPASAIIPVEEGSDTLLSIKAVADTMRNRGLHSLVLVSDPWHSLRTKAMAHEQGLDARTSPTRQGPAVTTRSSQVHGIIRETGALLYYRVTHAPTSFSDTSAATSSAFS